MPDLLQNVIIALAAAWAVWTIVRRVFATLGPARPGAATCDGCPNGQASRAGRGGETKIHPVTLVRERRS